MPTMYLPVQGNPSARATLDVNNIKTMKRQRQQEEKESAGEDDRRKSCRRVPATDKDGDVRISDSDGSFVEGSLSKGMHISRQSKRRSRTERSLPLWLALVALMLVSLIPAATAEDAPLRSLQSDNTPTASPQETLEEALQAAEEGEEEQELEQQQPTDTQEPTTTLLQEPFLNFHSFSQCDYTTQELLELAPDHKVEPCILFDIHPERIQIIPYRTTIITLVQVTPATICQNHRDGTTTSVELLNSLNNGKGLSVGFHQDYFIQFRLVSLIAGNGDELGAERYGLQHAAVLRTAVQALEADYIVGSCSFASAQEKAPALETQRMVLTQVGPPGFYQDNNPYVFGVHINSDEYPIPTVRALGFQAANVGPEAPTSLQKLPVRVLYRTQSEFFRSTCQSAVRALQEFGFVDLKDISYDPDADDDGDGVANALDEDFLIALADETCPPGSGDYEQHYNPALFACVLSEQDIIFQQWKENGCRPLSIWTTPATWGWATANPSLVPYMFGGGQWHEAFDYSDRFFSSGRDMLAYNEEKFGYFGNYDAVVSYAIPMIFAEHLESFYRVVDDPNPEVDFKTPEGYEALRRAMVVLNTDTIFGPLSYNDDQRNVGRGAAGTQWQTQTVNGTDVFRNVLVSPFLQAEADSKIPAPSAVNCTPGMFVNETFVIQHDAILESKCDLCPAETFTAVSNQQLSCNGCPEGSTTGGLEGGAYCVQEKDNLLPPGILAFGYLAVGVTWILSCVFIGWLVMHKNHPVVLLSQFEFMVMICIGAIISSSTIITLSIQAGSEEDTDAATRACKAAPFLYTIGWVLQYASLSAKSFRLAKIMNNQNGRRIKVTAFDTMYLVAVVLALDLVVVITWTATYPLEYVREVNSVEMDDTTNVMTISSSGSCAIPDGPSMWAFAGPLIAIHALLMITTNVILYKVRAVADRYQEQKYVALASAFVCEVLVIGLPVLVSVGDNPIAVFIVLTGLIAMNDMGMLCFVFIPKVKYQRKKIVEGVNVGETILKSTYSKAAIRESIRRAPSSHFGSSQFGISPSMVSRMSESGSGNDEDENENRSDRRRSDSNPRFPSVIDQSIIEGNEEDASEYEVNIEQAQRQSFATPRTDTGTEEEYDGFADENDEEQVQRRSFVRPQTDKEPQQEKDTFADEDDELKLLLEAEKLKTYALELEVAELREKVKKYETN